MGLRDLKPYNRIREGNAQNKLKIEKKRKTAKKSISFSLMKLCANAIEVLAIFIDDLNSILFKPRGKETTCHCEHDNSCGKLKCFERRTENKKKSID